MGFVRGARWSLFGLVGGSVLGLMGGQEVLDAAHNREPKVLSCEEFHKSPPEATWVKLTNCSMNIASATFFYDKKTNKLTDLYIPVFPNVENAPEKTKIGLHTKDSKWFGLVEKVRAVKDNPEKVREIISKDSDHYLVTTEIEGTVEHGMTKSSNEQEKFTKLNDEVAPGVIVIKHNDRPSLGAGLGMLAAGLLVGVFGLWRGLVSFRH